MLRQVQQEFAFIPQDSSAVYVINVEVRCFCVICCFVTQDACCQTNTTQQLAGPTVKDPKATYFASTNSLVQLSNNGTVSFLPYQEGNTSVNAAASWSIVKPLAAAAPPSTSTASASGTQTASGSSSTGGSSGSTSGALITSPIHVGLAFITLLGAMAYLV